MNRRFKLLYVMNIPSPYRWHLFTQLHQVGLENGIDFHVVFLSPGAPDRLWKLAEFPQSFSYRVPWGINLLRNGVRMLNPVLVAKLLIEEWDWIILGGYDNPTNAILALLPLPRTSIKIIKNEGNLQSTGRKTGLIAAIKRFLLQRSNAYFTVGQRSEEWLQYWVPDYTSKPTHFFPNIIDDEALVKQVAFYRRSCKELRRKWNLTDRRIFLSPARLSPEKGLVEYIRHLPDDFAADNVWIIAGDGHLRSKIEKELASRNLESCVKLVGNIHSTDMPELYAVADVFLLPSLSDANPLSVIEAAFAGLPLLVSRRAGNSPELVIEDVTGWCFEPSSAEETELALKKAIKAENRELQVMGRNSQSRAEALYRSDMVVRQLIEFLLSIHPDRREQ